MGVAGVTGGGGFIGSAVVRALQSRGYDVRAGMGPPGTHGRALPDSVEQRWFDITDRDAVRAFVDGCDALVHAAGPPSVLESFERPLACIEAHALGTATVLDACADTSVRRFVYVSSAEVYGRPKGPYVFEDDPLEPRSPYGAAKAAAEYFVRALAPLHALHAAIVRPFSVYGDPDRQSVLSEIVTQARSGTDIFVNDMAPVRDYCYVDDVAEAIACALERAPAEIQAYNVGTGVGTSVGDLAETVAEVLGLPAAVRERAHKKRAASAEIYYLVAGVDKIARDLGWTARHDLRGGLRAMFSLEGVP